MHPYEVSTTLRRAQKPESVRLNYGSLYAVVSSLEKRGLIAAESTHREGRLPERTVYTLTDAGRIELQDWLAELISTPVRDYTAFEAGLSFLPALSPEEALALLKERIARLEGELARRPAAMEETAAEQRIPRLFLVEHEYRIALRRAELDYVHELVEAIESGSLDGVLWWHSIHSEADAHDEHQSPTTTPNTTKNGGGSLRPGRN